MKNVASREKSIARKGQRKKGIKIITTKYDHIQYILHVGQANHPPAQQTTQEIMQAAKYDTSSQSCLCLK